MEYIKKIYLVFLFAVFCVSFASCREDEDSENAEEARIIYREYKYKGYKNAFRKAKVLDEYADIIELIETNEKDPVEGTQYWKFKIKKEGTARILWEGYEFCYWSSCWIEEITINEDMSYSSERIPIKLPENSKEVGASLEADIYENFTFEYNPQ